MWKGFICEALGSWNREISEALSWSYTYTVAMPGKPLQNADVSNKFFDLLADMDLLSYILQAIFNDTEEFVLCIDEPSNEVVIFYGLI